MWNNQKQHKLVFPYVKLTNLQSFFMIWRNDIGGYIQLSMFWHWLDSYGYPRHKTKSVDGGISRE